MLQMPDYFEHLCTDVLCYSSPGAHHFGLSFAQQDVDDPSKIIVGVSKAGLYNVLVTARRKDVCATTMCPQEIEYLPHVSDETDNMPHMPPTT